MFLDLQPRRPSAPTRRRTPFVIPSAKVAPVTDQIAGLGTVRSRGQTSEDVTQQSVDVASRLATQKASIARVRALLAQATRIADIVAIEGELSQRESDLESREA